MLFLARPVTIVSHQHTAVKKKKKHKQLSSIIAMAQTNLNIHPYLFSPTLSVRITKHTSYKNVYIIKKEKKMSSHLIHHFK